MHDYSEARLGPACRLRPSPLMVIAKARTTLVRCYKLCIFHSFSVAVSLRLHPFLGVH